MRFSPLRFSMRGLLVAVTVAALAAYWLRPPVVSAKIEWIGRELDSDDIGTMVVFRVTNTSPNSLWYWATGEQWPCSDCQTTSGGEWTNATFVTCGMGISVYELRKGQSRVCREFFTYPEKKIRLGLQLSVDESMDEEVTVWSQPIDPKQLPIVPAEDDAA